jgi:hypothetical protein
VNESSKEAPVNGGTNETSILRNHITNPQPGTSASTNTTNTSNFNEETLLPGIGIRQITNVFSFFDYTV